MDNNRFKGVDPRIRSLVLAFERSIAQGDSAYFDVDQMDGIIDFYLDVHDVDMLTHAVEYGNRLFPGDDEMELRRAEMLCVKDKFQEAEALLLQLLKRNSGNTDALYALGTLYSDCGQSRKAIEYYLLASKDGCELDMVYGNIADEYSKQGQQLSAIIYYKKALEINPNETRSILNLAHTFGSLDDAAGAAEYFRDFVQRQPYSAEGWLALGEALADCGLYERAEDALQYSIAIDKNYYDAYDELAHCYRVHGRYADAVNTLHEAMPLADSKDDVLCNIASCFLDQKNYATASVYYKKALDEDPYNTEARRLLAECYAMQGDYGAAQANIQRAIDQKPYEPEYHLALGMLLMRMEETDAGCETIRHAIELGGDRMEYWLQAADALMEGEWYEAAGTLLSDADRLAFQKASKGRQTAESLTCHTTGIKTRMAECMYQTHNKPQLMMALLYLSSHDPKAIEEMVHKHPDLLSDAFIQAMLHHPQ